MSEIVRDKSDAHIEIAPKKKTTKPKWAQKLELTKLPRLPIPQLETTLERYIEYVRPLLTPEQLAETKRKAGEFLAEEGPILDQQLRELAKESSTSWLEGFWNTMYLSWRDPIPIHINPCFVLEDDPTPLRNKMVPRAASLVYSTLWFIRLLHAGQLPGDFERSDPLCMSQYADLFGTTRIPQFGRDKLVTDYNSNHIAVVCQDQYYWFEITDQDKKPLEQEALELVFHQIVEDATGDPDVEVPPLGMMTTADRESWAATYNKLLEIPGNKAFMEKLTSALFLVCLDPHIPNGLVETSQVMLHSDGHNRWFDKSIQLIICENGKAGINMEHSPFDGHTCLRFAEDTFNYSVRMRCDSPASFTSSTDVNAGPPVPIHKLSFQLSPEIVDSIEHATSAYQKFAGSLSTGILHFVAYGKSFITKHSVSPDALVQLCFQIAQFRLSGKISSTYESAMTKRYYHGRTECMRPVTNELASLLMTLADPGSTSLDQMKALKIAAKMHGTRIGLCKQGEGVDRHLYGLHNLAKQKQIRLPGYNIPDIFTDIAWGCLRYDVLSTSNCGGYSLSSFGFGPVVPDGFGIGYIIKDKCMHFHITNYDEKKTKKFTKLLEQSLLDVAQLLVNGTPLRMEKKQKSKL